ncbi:MAG TPA: RNA methyltransferase [Pyrinomonadaceae bacterium]|nr:RNA methyltransferase [Pyrinomonadaceae bacterium]
MPKMITSSDNSLLRHARKVREGKVDDEIFVEGLRLCEEALSSHLQITAVIFSDDTAQKPRANRFLTQVSEVCNRVVAVSEKLLATVSYTKTPQGIVVLAERPESGDSVLTRTASKAELLVVMHGLNNPVNVGAILRTAEAAGATGVITTTNTTDLFSPKALRGAMGSAFRLPIWQGASFNQVLLWCAQRNITTVSADVSGPTVYTEFDWNTPSALVIGPEANGLSSEEINATTAAINIPMHGSVESLNVAVATAIVLYEAARQRCKLTPQVLS